MKAKLVVMGEERGIIEIGANSVIGKLLAGNLTGAMSELAKMEAEINEIGGAGTCQIDISEEATDGR